jgi:hypothetical protein
MAKLIDWRQREEELTEAITQIAICLAREIHAGDPEAAQRMNFTAAKAYSRMVDEGRPLAAEILYRFGRVLTDRTLFPLKPAAGQQTAEGPMAEPSEKEGSQPGEEPGS